MASALLCDRDLAWIPGLAANRENIEMSKNEADFTLPVVRVNEKHELRFRSESAAYKPSTAGCHSRGAAWYESTVTMRLRLTFCAA
jgi:hypothetical protein